MKISELIKQSESERLDFKQNAGNLAKIARSLCAFANTQGGILAIGISDGREVIGIDPEEQKYLFEQAAGKYCQPAIDVHFEVLEDEAEFEWLEPKQVLLAHIAEAKYKPIYYLGKSGEKVVYVRVGDKSLPASASLIKRMERGLPLHQVADAEQLNKHERRLFQYLENNERITASAFAQMVNISKQRAGKILVQLMQEGLLREHTIEKTTFYTK